MSQEKEFRVINQALGKQPKLGPFAFNQIIPFSLSIIMAFFLKQALDLNWINTILIAVWMMGTVWILTGKQAWRFLSKFVNVPYWVRSSVRYESPLFSTEPTRKRRNRQ